MTGKPVITGIRLTVQYILGLFEQGMTIADILEESNNLTKEDIFACLLFATQALDNTAVIPLEKEPL
jgi:uncharacterized protein (DUF433 family)